MATYDYHCPTCQATTKEVRSITEDAPKPLCGNCEVEMVRSYTAPGLQFKGNGWAGKKR